MKYLWITLMLPCVSYGSLHIPSGGPAFDAIVDGSFKHIDSNNNKVIERPEFNITINTADKNKNGCLTLEEYKTFSAGGPTIATGIYRHFDISNSNCIQLANVASQFDAMDTPHKNGKVTAGEFRQYYANVSSAENS